MKILCLNGINLNMFGKRDPAQYGTITLAEIDAQVKQLGKDLGGHVECFQTNFEGAMVEKIHQAHADQVDAVMINAGAWTQQQAQIRATIAARGEEVGFKFNPGGRGRVYNTFNAHRLLHWAGVKGPEGSQHALKRALLESYQGRAEAVESDEVLLAVVASVGLDVSEAKGILASDAYAQEVREIEQFYQQAGIHSVPAIIINDKHLISGGQPAAVFEQALRRIAAGEV
ncbi:MAG: type II 3-dehydroquinate dehydratase [Betaproteobacteria bacterium]|nr:type II 3-dehydroquinate dehydratase [Betaproteobacteria bacterium]